MARSTVWAVALLLLLAAVGGFIGGGNILRFLLVATAVISNAVSLTRFGLVALISTVMDAGLRTRS